MENENILNAGMDNLKKVPTLYLKTNKTLKELGFKAVNINQRLEVNSYEPDLTLFICPSGTSNYFQRNLPSEVKLKWGTMKGYLSREYIYLSSFNDDETNIEKIFIDNFEVGHYYKNRNIVILSLNILRIIENIPKNEWYLHILEEFSKEIKRINPQVVDITKAQREGLLNNFLKEIEKSVLTMNNSVTLKLEYVEDYRTKELSKLTEVNQIREQIKVLMGMKKTMQTNIEKTIQEIRKLPFVRKVGISNLGIRVDFRHIDLEWEGNKVPLGECYCYLNPSKLRIENKQYVKVNNNIYYSPHISGNNICFGSGKTKAYELLSQMKFKELVYFIYLYLKTYNEGDTYCSLKSWKKAKENGGVYSENDDDDEEMNEDE